MPSAQLSDIAHARIYDASYRPKRSAGDPLHEAELWRDLRECALLLLAFHAGNVVAPIVGALSRPDGPLP